MTTLTIQVSGEKEVADRLRRFGISILDLTRAMDQTGRYLSRFFAGEVFASRGGVIGKPWPALNDNYAVWKAEQWPGRPPLVRTGLMNRSFKHRSTKLSAELWNEADYFKYHQGGWGVPQRVMMGLDAKRERGVAQLIAGEIVDKMRTADV